MIHAGLQDAAPQFVTQYFARTPTAHLLFHNLQHTQNVVRHALEIATYYNLDVEERQTIFLAAWMHDLGHLTGPSEGHEARSVAIFHDFLNKQGVDDVALASAVEACILATRFPHNPGSRLEEIMCDADTYHLGTEDFKTTNKLVKEELKLRGETAPLANWPVSTFRLLDKHHFFTDYCIQKLQAGKEQNVSRISKKVEKAGGLPPETKVEHAAAQAITISENKEAKKDASLVARGIQTMLRLASQNHLELSNLADGKSNILISVNAIIISLILSVVVRKLETEPYLTIPTAIFLTSSLTTIVLAILATRPKVTEGSFTREDIISKKTNLLFFGNFYRTSREEYEWAMARLMQDKDYLYSSLVKDIYYLGIVLGRKYKLLRLAYNIFMVGLIISVVSFVLAVLLRTPDQHVIITNGTSSPL